jgi:Flp pilus assembly pilin Flp
MLRLPDLVSARPQRERGQGIVEYGLILTLSAIVALVTLVLFGGTLAEVLDFIERAIDANAS